MHNEEDLLTHEASLGQFVAVFLAPPEDKEAKGGEEGEEEEEEAPAVAVAVAAIADRGAGDEAAGPVHPSPLSRSRVLCRAHA